MIIDFIAQHGLNNALGYFLFTNSKILENFPCKNGVFVKKMAKNDQNLDILTFDPIFGLDIHRIGSN